jgi:uncharacterized protein (DUF433 family)
MADGAPHLATPHEFVRAFLSLKEVTMLADVKEALVRKDIEHNVICPVKYGSNRLVFRWPDVYLFAAVYRHERFNRETRRQIVNELECVVEPEFRKERYLRSFHAKTYPMLHLHPSKCVREMRVDVDAYTAISMSAVKSECAPAVDRYARGLARIEEREGVMGGEAVFRGTRLPVKHIGKLRACGESVEDIRLDYPYLDEPDIDFAEMYFKAHPAIGRPRESGGGPDGGIAN